MPGDQGFGDAEDDDNDLVNKLSAQEASKDSAGANTVEAVAKNLKETADSKKC